MNSVTPAFEHRVKSIESWFRAHEDGEFCVYPVEYESEKCGDSSTARTIVYTTKPHCVSRVYGVSDFVCPIATIGRYGLPLTRDLAFLLSSTDQPTRIFVGDADPPDLLIFSWLREHVPIGWYGVNDDLLNRHQNRDYVGIIIRMSKAESAAVSMLPEICPDFRQLLGEYCSSLLDDGFKIELEGAILNRGELLGPEKPPRPC